MIIKEKPEDFVVDEVIHLNFNEKGKYLYIRVKKINRNTLDIVDILSRKLKLDKKDIGFAGMKDKRAVTSQVFSIRTEKEIKNDINEVEIEILGRGDKPISLGELEGNKFKIKIDFKPKQIEYAVNYFGEQRFSENNKEIGKFILTGKFKEAVELIKNKNCDEYVANHKNDYIGGLKVLERRLLSLYINSYQSFLWNEVVSEYIKRLKHKEYEGLNYNLENEENVKVPFLTFDVKFGEFKEAYEELMKKEGITLRNFVIKQMPELSPLAASREMFVKIEDYSFENEIIEFRLGKGSYATSVLKHIYAVNH